MLPDASLAHVPDRTPASSPLTPPLASARRALVDGDADQRGAGSDRSDGASVPVGLRSGRIDADHPPTWESDVVPTLALTRRGTAFLLCLATASLVIGACGESSTAPRPDLSPASLTPIALGDNQTAVAGSPVANPPAVTVRNAAGDPLAGIAVTFAVTAGGGAATGTTAMTSAMGIATVGSWTLGTTAGANAMTASVSGLGTTVTFTATGSPGAPVALTAVAGNCRPPSGPPSRSHSR
jgi:LysM repeat protein